ncbi:MAG: ATP synthase subunit I [Deltaproteobacteria bacterium]|nr:ATP synthase subunit I [Deltaproteobacteria bacterium]MBW2086067.1 ATP synthase subunit I [Deltaproteobacteria bacterium]
MESLIQFKKTISVQIVVIAAVVAVIALGLGYVNVARGFVLGSIFSWGNFFVMNFFLASRLGKRPRRAGVESTLSLLVRLSLLGLPIFLAVRYSTRFNLVWTIIGILNLQISVLFYQLVVERYGLVRSTDLKRR